jgi:hypothetical protein
VNVTVSEPATPSKAPVWTTLALFGIATLVFTYGFASFLRIQSKADLDIHIDYARQLDSLANLTSPHFLFQVLLKGLNAVGLSYETAAVWVLGVCYGGMAVLIGREMRRRGVTLGPIWTVTLVMCVLLASHIFLLTASRPNLYYGYFVPIAYHNPTQQLNKLFALWIWFVYRSNFLFAPAAPLSSIPVLGGLCVASALAKPSFLIAFVPTAALYTARDVVTGRWRHALVCALAIGVPSALVLAWQARFTYGIAAPVQVAFAPFVVFDAFETLYKLPASLAFPLIVAAGAWLNRAWDGNLTFVWILTALSLFATLGLVETGERMMQGNFAWTGQTAVFLIYVESMLRLLTRPPRPWVYMAWAVFAVHVACGVVWYGVMFWPERPQWL